jgi:hypothetical protein
MKIVRDLKPGMPAVKKGPQQKMAVLALGVTLLLIGAAAAQPRGVGEDPFIYQRSDVRPPVAPG